MQTRSLKDDKIKDAMKESQILVKTLALVHEKKYPNYLVLTLSIFSIF
ncbi:hypothetical protein [Shivajiella indica]|uniref:Uncharacterized protein n=1 Tax=Shivajiella indica TaxID=872115 RepID=A0ABW5B770_9BACT